MAKMYVAKRALPACPVDLCIKGRIRRKKQPLITLPHLNVLNLKRKTKTSPHNPKQHEETTLNL